MRRETQRRLFVLAVVAALAAAWAVSQTPAPVATPVAAAAPAAAPPAAPSRSELAAVRPHVKSCPFPAALRPAFVAAARDTDLPLALLYSVAKIESNLRPDVISESGARGLLQLMPTTARMLALDIDEPSANVLAGARYLRQQLDRFSSTDLALAAYNAGPTAVEQAGGAPSGAVLVYVANVTALWRSLAGCR
jgi:soluble lytic murein transglycosylase-like protein